MYEQMNELMNGYSCVNTEFSLCQVRPGQAAYGRPFLYSPLPILLPPSLLHLSALNLKEFLVPPSKHLFILNNYIL